ncbi:hypothetical protein J4732_21310 [Serratia marcescens]|uniref:Uncharacterized protein n=1 Tax=Serratia marcescens TaxID=615 RepID=A0A939SVJ7_SERMA|nr:hypothetical protein [Serratia marcescens]
MGANGALVKAPPIVCLSIPIKPWLEAVNNVAFGNDVGDNPLLAPLRQLTF